MLANALQMTRIDTHAGNKRRQDERDSAQPSATVDDGIDYTSRDCALLLQIREQLAAEGSAGPSMEMTSKESPASQTGVNVREHATERGEDVAMADAVAGETKEGQPLAELAHTNTIVEAESDEEEEEDEELQEDLLSDYGGVEVDPGPVDDMHVDSPLSPAELPQSPLPFSHVTPPASPLLSTIAHSSSTSVPQDSPARAFDGSLLAVTPISSHVREIRPLDISPFYSSVLQASPSPLTAGDMADVPSPLSAKLLPKYSPAHESLHEPHSVASSSSSSSTGPHDPPLAHAEDALQTTPMRHSSRDDTSSASSSAPPSQALPSPHSSSTPSVSRSQSLAMPHAPAPSPASPSQSRSSSSSSPPVRHHSSQSPPSPSRWSCVPIPSSEPHSPSSQAPLMPQELGPSSLPEHTEREASVLLESQLIMDVPCIPSPARSPLLPQLLDTAPTSGSVPPQLDLEPPRSPARTQQQACEATSARAIERASQEEESGSMGDGNWDTSPHSLFAFEMPTGHSQDLHSPPRLRTVIQSEVPLFDSDATSQAPTSAAAARTTGCATSTSTFSESPISASLRSPPFTPFAPSAPVPPAVVAVVDATVTQIPQLEEQQEHADDSDADNRRCAVV